MASPSSTRDAAYAALLDYLATLVTAIAPGRTAVVCAAVRPSPDTVWVGSLPNNMLGDRYALQLPLMGQNGQPFAHEDVLRVLRRAESIRRHDQTRFNALPEVGNLHGAPVLDTGTFREESTSFAMFQDSLRTAVRATVLDTAQPPTTHSRLAGFSWFSPVEPQWCRFYFTAPAGLGKIGIDLDNPENLSELLICSDVPGEWVHHEYPPDDFCDRLFDLRKTRE